MSEIAVRHDNHAVDLPASQDQAINRLIEWAQVADAAFTMAKTLCNTKFAPAGYRGKPEEAAAAILAGAEVGLSPMASLRAFDDIQGTPAPKAITLRAIVQGLGHDVRIVESGPDRAVVAGRRKGDAEWQTSTWDMARATQMGLATKPQWKAQPAAMLIARATAEVCRWIASDAIMGMAYTVEELRDDPPPADLPAPARPVTAAEILGHPDPSHAPRTDELMTPDQSGRLNALFSQVDITDRDLRISYVNEALADAYGPYREITAAAEMTTTDAAVVISKLQAWADNAEPADDTAGGA